MRFRKNACCDETTCRRRLCIIHNYSKRRAASGLPKFCSIMYPNSITGCLSIWFRQQSPTYTDGIIGLIQWNTQSHVLLLHNRNFIDLDPSEILIDTQLLYQSQPLTVRGLYKIRYTSVKHYIDPFSTIWWFRNSSFNLDFNLNASSKLGKRGKHLSLLLFNPAQILHNKFTCEVCHRTVIQGRGYPNLCNHVLANYQADVEDLMKKN